MIVKTSTINRQNILTLELRKFTIFFIIVSPLYFIKCYNFFTYFIIISNYNPKYNVYKHFSLLLTPLIPYITSVKQKECYKKSTLSIAFFQIIQNLKRSQTGRPKLSRKSLTLRGHLIIYTLLYKHNYFDIQKLSCLNT